MDAWGSSASGRQEGGKQAEWQWGHTHVCADAAAAGDTAAASATAAAATPGCRTGGSAAAHESAPGAAPGAHPVPWDSKDSMFAAATALGATASVWATSALSRARMAGGRTSPTKGANCSTRPRALRNDACCRTGARSMPSSKFRRHSCHWRGGLPSQRRVSRRRLKRHQVGGVTRGGGRGGGFRCPHTPAAVAPRSRGRREAATRASAQLRGAPNSVPRQWSHHFHRVRLRTGTGGLPAGRRGQSAAGGECVMPGGGCVPPPLPAAARAGGRGSGGGAFQAHPFGGNNGSGMPGCCPRRDWRRHSSCSWRYLIRGPPIGKRGGSKGGETRMWGPAAQPTSCHARGGDYFRPPPPLWDAVPLDTAEVLAFRQGLLHRTLPHGGLQALRQPRRWPHRQIRRRGVPLPVLLVGTAAGDGCYPRCVSEVEAAL